MTRGLVMIGVLLSGALLPGEAIGDVPPTPDLARVGDGGFAEFAVGWGSHEFDAIPWETREYEFAVDTPVWGPLHVRGDFVVGEAGDIDYDKHTEYGNTGVDVSVRHGWAKGRSRWHAGGGLRAWLPTATGYNPTPLGFIGNPPLLLNGAHHTYDPGRFAPYTWTIRPNVAVARETSWAFVQLESGADVFVPTDPPQSADNEYGYHVGGAAGLYIGPFTGYAELAYFECTTCDVPIDVDPKIEAPDYDTLGLAAAPPVGLVVGFRASLGRFSLGMAIRDWFGETGFLKGVPLRLDVSARF